MALPHSLQRNAFVLAMSLGQERGREGRETSALHHLRVAHAERCKDEKNGRQKQQDSDSTPFHRRTSLTD
jgi:hypothetical protein